MRTFKSIKSKCTGAILLMLSFCSVVLTGCKEEVDLSNRYTFTGEMMTDHFANNAEFSKYYELLGRVRQSKKTESTVASLLSARGNYTCFAPTDSAVSLYLDSMLIIGQVETKVISEIPDSVAEAIVYNSIIENGNNEAYKTTEFVDGALSLTNMNDRYITVKFDTLPGKTMIIRINNRSLIQKKDIEVENGIIHTVDHVVSPSSESVPDLLLNMENMKLFTDFLQETGWDKKLRKYLDLEYENNHPEEITGFDGTKIPTPDHRKYGYTAFIETDETFHNAGITDIKSLSDYLKGLFDAGKLDAYRNATWGKDYKSPENAVNQFIAYHLLPQSLSYDKLVIHYNEYGYNYNSSKSPTISVFEYYETMGVHRRLLKVTESEKSGGIRLNRHASLNRISYKENFCNREGILVYQDNGKHGSTSALNGYIYPIKEILVFDNEVPNTVLNERIRFDIASILPEIMTNGMRRLLVALPKHAYRTYPKGYFENLTPSNETVTTYLPGLAMGWANYQGDEFIMSGKYDFILRLPPVPYTGTYELRYGISANTLRGMAQVYLGQDKNNLAAQGIPLDLRKGGTTVGWQADKPNEDDFNNEVEKQMRNLGYLKGPLYSTLTPGGTNTLRGHSPVSRRIIYTGQFEEGKTYYIRFKSVLDKTDSQFFFDYMELVPRSVYNGIEAEDKW